MLIYIDVLFTVMFSLCINNNNKLIKSPIPHAKHLCDLILYSNKYFNLCSTPFFFFPSFFVEVIAFNLQIQKYNVFCFCFYFYFFKEKLYSSLIYVDAI